MPPEVLDYIKNQRVGVLAVEMMDGSPHAATVHFAYTEQPFVLYFKSENKTKKAQPLNSKQKVRASYVIGVSEAEMKTLQMDGFLERVSPEEKPVYDTVFYGRFSEKTKKDADPTAAYLKFTPTWWRFTDWTLPQGKTIIEK